MTNTESEDYGIFRFSIPDDTVTAEERGLYAFAASKEVVEEKLVLHDARTDSNIIKGAEGLDVQGFTYIKHESALTKSGEWFSGQNVEDVYLPEVCELICKLTGAKRAVVNNVAFRRRLADMQTENSKYVLRKGGELDKEIEKLPRDRPLVYGKEVGGSLEPARMAHVDYSLTGLRQTARYCRHDIAEAAREALAAEDASQVPQEIPRYAAYSVWRPVSTVKRDPLAVLDWRSLDKSSLKAMKYRAISDINESGEYLVETWAVLPPKDPQSQRWYWMPEQEPDEVLILKFADTEADKNPEIAGACVHLSPDIPGTENEEPRASIEARVLAFW